VDEWKLLINFHSHPSLPLLPSCCVVALHQGLYQHNKTSQEKSASFFHSDRPDSMPMMHHATKILLFGWVREEREGGQTETFLEETHTCSHKLQRSDEKMMHRLNQS
jgi:hypothetical protein